MKTFCTYLLCSTGGDSKRTCNQIFDAVILEHTSAFVLYSLLKWPNLCCFIVFPGIGVNVSNANPTTCINDVIKLYNRDHESSPLRPLSTEVVIARSVTRFEQLIGEINRSKNGCDAFLERYYKKWIHR